MIPKRTHGVLELTLLQLYLRQLLLQLVENLHQKKSMSLAVLITAKWLNEDLPSLYDPELTTALTQIYDPKTDTWTIETPMLTSRYALGAAVIDDKMYAIGGKKGGEPYPTEYYRKNEIYTPVGYIPEFPLGLVVPLFLVVSLVAVCYRKRLGLKSLSSAFSCSINVGE